jgi:hypothetical protein
MYSPSVSVISLLVSGRANLRSRVHHRHIIHFIIHMYRPILLLVSLSYRLEYLLYLGVDSRQYFSK